MIFFTTLVYKMTLLPAAMKGSHRPKARKVVVSVSRKTLPFSQKTNAYTSPSLVLLLSLLSLFLKSKSLLPLRGQFAYWTKFPLLHSLATEKRLCCFRSALVSFFGCQNMKGGKKNLPHGGRGPRGATAWAGYIQLNLVTNGLNSLTVYQALTKEKVLC